MSDSSRAEASETKPAALKRNVRWSVWPALWLIAVVVAACAAAVLSAWDSVTPLASGNDLMSLHSVAVLKPAVKSVLDWFWFWGASAFLAAGGLFCLLRRRRFGGVANLLAALVMTPLVWLLAAFANPASYWATSRIVGSDGRTYAFLDSEFLQGQVLALGVRTREGLITEQYDEVGVTYGDSPRSWAAVIRPDGAPESYGQLLINNAGFIVGFRSGLQAYFAYDTDSGRFLGRDEIKDISPFVLIDDGVRMNERDIDAIMASKGSEGDNGVPHMRHLVAAASSPAPDIQQAAKRLMTGRQPTTEQSDHP